MKSRITVKQLGTALKNDEYYNGDALFPFPVNEIQRIMKEVMQSLKDDDQGQKSFTEWYHNLPDSNPDAIAFAAILCTGIDKYLSSTEEKEAWRYDGFSEDFSDDLEVYIGDLKLHFRKFNLPLPADIFPECNDNTKACLQLRTVKFNPKYSKYPIVNNLGQKITDLLMKTTKSGKEKGYKQEMIATLFEKWKEAKEIANFEDTTDPLELKLQWERGDEYYWKDAKKESWPLLFAILFISHCATEDKDTFHWWRKSLLYKTSHIKTKWKDSVEATEGENGIHVTPHKWLKWCEGQGLYAPEAVWSSVAISAGKKKATVFCERYPRVKLADIMSICDADGELKSTDLFDEYCQRTDELNLVGWSQDKASAIAGAIIQKGEALKVRH